jgi:micrococcal nuclease
MTHLAFFFTQESAALSIYSISCLNTIKVQHGMITFLFLFLQMALIILASASDKHRYPFKSFMFDVPTKGVDMRVLRVIDGDTVVVENASDPGGKGEHIRLTGIDAPERTQAAGLEATEALKSLIAEDSSSPNDLHVILRRHGYDGYGRTLGTLYRATDFGDGDDYTRGDLNLEMIRRGWAWAYEKPSDNIKAPPGYMAAQLDARVMRLGLWQAPFPQNPSDFRAEKRRRAKKHNKHKKKRGKKSPPSELN